MKFVKRSLRKYAYLKFVELSPFEFKQFNK